MTKQRIRTQLSVEVPPELLERLKAAAAQTSRTVTSIVVDFLEASLDETSSLAHDTVLAERVAAVERSLRMVTKDAISGSLGVDLESMTMSEAIEATTLAWLDAQEPEVEPREHQATTTMQPLASIANGDGLRMSSWWESRGVPRSTAFRLVKLAGIEPIKRKVRGVRVPVTFLDAGQVAQLDAIVDRLNEGETIAQVEAAWKPIPVPA